MVLISEFARVTGLSTDTVRFYVRKGLLAPETGMKGGSNPYQIFTAEHVEAARIIRMAQGLGFSLREIAALAAEYHGGGMTPERSLELMRMQLVRLEEKAGQLNAMVDYTRAKVAWLEGGQQGPEPLFGDYAGCWAAGPDGQGAGGLKTRAPALAVAPAQEHAVTRHAAGWGQPITALASASSISATGSVAGGAAVMK